MARFVQGDPQQNPLPITRRMQRFKVTELIIGSNRCAVTIDKTHRKRIFRPYAIWLAGGPLADNDTGD